MYDIPHDKSRTIDTEHFEAHPIQVLVSATSEGGALRLTATDLLFIAAFTDGHDVT